MCSESLTDVPTPVLHRSGALKGHDTGFSSVSHLLRNYQLREAYHCAYKLMLYKTGGVGMLLTALSGIVGLVQFLYSNFFQSIHFFFSPSFLPLLPVSAYRGKNFEIKTIKIDYVEIKKLNLMKLQIKMMTSMFIE